MRSTISDKFFREAAQQKFPEATVPRWGNVERPHHGGAFVEVQVWVSEEEAREQVKAKEPEPVS